MFNRSEILKAAWREFKQYDRHRVGAQRKQVWAMRLRYAWACARRAIELAAEALLSPVERERIRIEREIDALQYLPFGMAIAPRRAALEAKLSRLAA